MSKKLTGKVALVTGGSRGIGAATARALADDGADVAISYVASAGKAEAVVRDLESKGVRAAAFKADQADPAQVSGLVRLWWSALAASIFSSTTPACAATGSVDNPENNLAEFDRQLAVNFGGVVAGIRAAAKVMGEGGRIISIGSCLGSHVGSPGLADYSATKAAIVGYTKGAARDLGPRKITVNVVQPGPVDTEMNPADGADAPSQKAVTALGRYAEPEEIAAGIVFLAGPAASYITGSVLDIDGGFGA